MQLPFLFFENLTVIEEIYEVSTSHIKIFSIYYVLFLSLQLLHKSDNMS